MNPVELPWVHDQGGGFTAKQARSAVGWEQIQRWLDDELIVRESNRFYRLVGAPGDTRSRILRAQARLGEPLVACHTTAAELHGFGVLPDPNLHVTTATGRSIRGPEGVVVHQLVPRAPIARVDGLHVIDAADAAVDVAAGGRPIDVLAVLDAARRAGVSEDRLRRAVDGASRQRGILVVRDLATQASPLPESPMESRTRYRILEAGLPPPELQVKVRVSGGGTRRLDHGWRRARVGLEFDGQDFHAGDGSLDRDRHKQADLLAAGWTVIYVTASDVYRMPERFTDPLRVLLGRRGCLTTATVQPAAS